MLPAPLIARLDQAPPRADEIAARRAEAKVQVRCAVRDANVAIGLLTAGGVGALAVVGKGPGYLLGAGAYLMLAMFLVLVLRSAVLAVRREEEPKGPDPRASWPLWLAWLAGAACWFLATDKLTPTLTLGAPLAGIGVTLWLALMLAVGFLAQVRLVTALEYAAEGHNRLKPIRAEHAPAVVDWCRRHPRIAGYQAAVARQGRDLLELEFDAMLNHAHEAEEAARRHGDSRLDTLNAQALEALKRPLRPEFLTGAR